MTPRIKDSNSENSLEQFSEQLLTQLQTSKKEFDLSGASVYFDFLHPALIKTKYLFDHHRHEMAVKQVTHGRMIHSFKNLKEAQLHYPQVANYGGLPWQIFKLLQDDPHEALVDFGPLGSAYLSRTIDEKTNWAGAELHDYLLPVWLDYALSPELWGPSGKWVRFDERFRTLFMKFGLLIDQSQIGYYRLRQEASWLKTKGFKGKESVTEFTMIPNWDFPLSGLIELENILARGP